MNLIINWLISALAVIISAYLLPGVTINGFFAALVVAVVLAAINLLIKPIILVLTLPINIVTLGLFTLVINAALVLLAAAIVPGFGVAGFWWALLFALVLSIVGAVLGQFDRKTI
jgi:putative membrane protein